MPLASIAEPSSADRRDALDHGGLDLCLPMLLHGCSDAPVRAGRRYPQRAADSGGRTKWQLPADVGIIRRQVRENIGTKQRTLNPRVRGSSPWRRTRSDLGFYTPGFLLSGRPNPASAGDAAAAGPQPPDAAPPARRPSTPTSALAAPASQADEHQVEHPNSHKLAMLPAVWPTPRETGSRLCAVLAPYRPCAGFWHAQGLT